VLLGVLVEIGPEVEGMTAILIVVFGGAIDAVELTGDVLAGSMVGDV
jgi:hypothetical protein